MKCFHFLRKGVQKAKTTRFSSRSFEAKLFESNKITYIFLFAILKYPAKKTLF